MKVASYYEKISNFGLAGRLELFPQRISCQKIAAA